MSDTQWYPINLGLGKNEMKRANVKKHMLCWKNADIIRHNKTGPTGKKC